MTISEADWKFEKDRLTWVYEKIQDELSRRREDIKACKGEIIASRREMWENTSSSPQQFEEMVEAQQHIDQLKREWEKYQFAHKLVERMERIALSPYFARVDFHEENEKETEKIYIGALSFIDNDTREIYIYDWRAPISSIFYDYEVGCAKYKCLDGEIQGDISLKRQFRIFRDNIEYMFDSSLKIDDEILQRILSKSADDKMKNIVATIQREQNRVIRNEEDKVLIVQGVAGSGKTSIALHRAAYLLYRYRYANLSSNNIVIFSPNKVFGDYISNVLPELGEENIRQDTFLDFARGFIGTSFRYEDSSTQIEYLLGQIGNNGYDTRKKGVEFKNSGEFLSILKNYLKYIEDRYISFSDIFYEKERIISKDEILQLYYGDYRHYPVAKRLGRISDRILFLLAPFEKREHKRVQDELESDGEHKGEVRVASRLQVSKKFKPLRESIESMTTIDSHSLYYDLFTRTELFREMTDGLRCPENMEEIRKDTIERLDAGYIAYEDLAPLFYLKTALEGPADSEGVKHVIIDEAQDYSVVQYEVFKQHFKHCSITMLGDLNQSIYFNAGADHYDSIASIFEETRPRLLSLTRSYRPTKELVEFSRAVLQENKEIEAISRLGDKPVLVSVPDETELVDKVVKDIARMSGEGLKSIAVICKTARESKTAYSLLKKRLDIKLVSKDDEEFIRGVVVIPSYLAKGLEFDGVIIYNANEESYSRENERRLLYVNSTRALHKLRIYYQGVLSPFLSGINKDLYSDC